MDSKESFDLWRRILQVADELDIRAHAGDLVYQDLVTHLQTLKEILGDQTDPLDDLPVYSFHQFNKSLIKALEHLATSPQQGNLK
jgi:hypothetical protein